MIAALRLSRARLRSTVNGRILSAIVLVAGLSVLVRIVSFGRELVVAHELGTGDVLDSFLVALILPSAAVTIAGGSIQTALVPAIIQARERSGERAAQRLFRNVSALSFLIFIGVAVVLGGAAEYALPIVAGGFGAEKLALAQTGLYALLPFVVLGGLAIVWGGVLNAGERFTLAAVVPVATPVAVIGLLLLGDSRDQLLSLSLGTSLGAMVEVAVLGWGLRRQGYSVLPRWQGMDPATRTVLGQSLPMVAGFILMSGAGIIDQAMAAHLAPGSVAALAYGNRIAAFAIGIGSIAISTAVLPYFSRMVAAEDWQSVRHTLRTFLRLIALTTIPPVLALIYFSVPLASLLFERGAFTAADSRLVGTIQAMYLIQVPFYLLGTLIVRLVSSMQANHLLMWGSAINLTLNIVFNLLFMRWLGVAGIALSTSAVYMISLVYLWYVSTRLIGPGAKG